MTSPELRAQARLNAQEQREHFAELSKVAIAFLSDEHRGQMESILALVEAYADESNANPAAVLAAAFVIAGASFGLMADEIEGDA